MQTPQAEIKISVRLRALAEHLADHHSLIGQLPALDNEEALATTDESARFLKAIWSGERPERKAPFTDYAEAFIATPNRANFKDDARDHVCDVDPKPGQPLPKSIFIVLGRKMIPLARFRYSNAANQGLHHDHQGDRRPSLGPDRRGTEWADNVCKTGPDDEVRAPREADRPGYPRMGTISLHVRSSVSA
ncbi:hypothetical protein [Rhodococcus sp. (in: high G+C Gram-positive bacteria)]|uniref:hypothetical protein n=1 Tax=Rhodococcus sp. TaxID=1831 RepID=UPI00257DA73D|nr:hypothetical protein [Rhodococcus sp. (in: high G+C Gram-positive bacteria)]MBQ7803080.1 hypothetical protein [Rhodococcus sp. (in: high G+C Gram-positive bacteria)]